MNQQLTKRRKGQIWNLLDQVEFELRSLKDDLSIGPDTLETEIEKQRKRLLDAARLVRRTK